MKDLMQFSLDDSRFNNILDIRESYDQASDVIKIEIIDQISKKEKAVKDILVYRGEHYCQDNLFISNFTNLFKMENRDLIES